MAKTHQEKQDERIAAIAATYTVEELLYRINENLAAIKGWVSFWGWGTLLLAVVVAVIQAFLGYGSRAHPSHTGGLYVDSDRYLPGGPDSLDTGADRASETCAPDFASLTQ